MAERENDRLVEQVRYREPLGDLGQAQPFPIKNVYREDVVVPGLDRQEVLDNAPAPQDGRFRVPPSNGSES